MSTTRRKFLQVGCGAAASASAAKPGPVQLSNGQLTLGFRLASGAPAALPILRNENTGHNWSAENGAISPLLRARSIPSSTAALERWEGGAQQLEITSRFSCGANVRELWRVVPGTPVAEYTAVFRNAGHETIEAVNKLGLRFSLRNHTGPIDVYAISRDTYAVQSLPFASELAISGGGWNRPVFAGMLVLRSGENQEMLLIGVRCEREWRVLITEQDGARWLQFEISDFEHSMASGEAMNLPPLFLAVLRGTPDDAFRAGQRYLRAAVFPKPLPKWPWVVYDIWGTEAQGVEQALLDEIGTAAGLGVELFYVDASWYAGSSKKGDGDWGCGLGHYAEDREKFPRGLAYLSSQVHAHGMKFGLWIGPNIVDSRLVPDSIPHDWIAQKDGEDRVLRIPKWESPCLQVCFGCPQYVDFLKRNLAGVVRDFSLDWLKWDNSGIPGKPGQCNRADHGHQAGDASYAAMLGQYEVFNHLHREFPDLVLEQCGYGSRLDLGLANTIRSNWLSDASFPSAHVRHNSLVASHIYPSAYNGAWVLRDKELESAKSPALLDTIYRSRMMGLFGFGTLHGTLPERVSLFPAEALEAARRNVPFFKRYRHLLLADAYHLFPPAGSPQGWQAVQFNSEDRRQGVVLCFRNGSPQSVVRLPIQGLDSRLRYKMTSANGTTFAATSGSELLRGGLVIHLDEPEMSEIVLLNA